MFHYTRYACVIDVLTVYIQTTETHLRQKDTQLDQKMRTIQNLNTQVREKDERLRRRDIEVRGKETQLHQKDEVIHKKDADISRLQKELRVSLYMYVCQRYNAANYNNSYIMCTCMM